MDIVNALEGIPYAAAVAVALLWHRVGRLEGQCDRLQTQGVVDGKELVKLSSTLHQVAQRVEDVATVVGAARRHTDLEAHT